MSKKILQPLKKSCKTCPFVKDSPYEYLREALTKSALTEATRICHSTGSDNAINRRTGKPPRACRGARDLQLKMFAGLGFIEAPTDKARADKCKEVGLK